MRRTAVVAALLVALGGGASPRWARAQEDEPPLGESDFGPVVEIERIDVAGNARTGEKIVRRALLVHEGDRLHAGDPRLNGSRWRVLALGYFLDVRLELGKGSRRGLVTITVRVVERGTTTLNRLFLGTSDLTDIWLGLDVGDTNLFGTGVAVSAAAVWADAPDLPGGEPQWALRLRAADTAVMGSRFGVRGSFLYADASEAVESTDPPVSEARGYRRVGGVAGVTYDVSRLATIGLDVRVEQVSAGAVPPPFLRAADSLVSSVAVGVDIDRRPDPVLPYTGDRFVLSIEGGVGDYDFVRAGARYGIWRRLTGRHIGSLQVGAGTIAGDAPLFDRFYVGDLNPLLPPRALDLVISTRPSPDFLGTGMDELRYGRHTAFFSLEYAYQLFRWARTVHGGDLFASVGMFGLGDADSFAVDLTFNAGLRLDNAIGVFELSLGNALGRIPF